MRGRERGTFTLLSWVLQEEVTSFMIEAQTGNHDDDLFLGKGLLPPKPYKYTKTLAIKPVATSAHWTTAPDKYAYLANTAPRPRTKPLQVVLCPLPD